MNLKRLVRATIGLGVLLPATAMAHPGHGGLEPTSAAHHLLELPHALWLVAGAAVAISVLVRRRRSSK